MDRQCAVSVAEAKEDQELMGRDETWAIYGEEALEIAVQEALIKPDAWDNISDAIGDLGRAELNLIGHYLNSGDFLEVGRRIDRAVRQYMRDVLADSPRASEIARALSEGTQARVTQ